MTVFNTQRQVGRGSRASHLAYHQAWHGDEGPVRQFPDAMTVTQFLGLPRQDFVVFRGSPKETLLRRPVLVGLR